MIDTPFRFESELSPEDYQKIGVLSLRWSHIDHVIGNCLKVMLRLSDEEAIVAIFPLSTHQRLDHMKKVAKLNGLPADAQTALDELRVVMTGIQYVRNNVVHAIIVDDETEGHVFHLRSKERSLTKAEVFCYRGIDQLRRSCGLVPEICARPQGC